MPQASSLVPPPAKSPRSIAAARRVRLAERDVAEHDAAEAGADAERVRRALAGDGTAFEELYRKYRPAVFKVAYGVTGNVEDALDVAQEAFIKAHRSLQAFEGRASVLTWLCQIAIHQAIDLGRRKKVRRSVELLDSMRPAGAERAGRSPGRPGERPAGESGSDEGAIPGDKARSRLPDHMGPQEEHDPAVLAAGNELKDALSKALSDLSEKHREVFLLYTVKGLSYREIADALGISIGTVMSRLFYARKNLQGLLAEFAG